MDVFRFSVISFGLLFAGYLSGDPIRIQTLARSGVLTWQNTQLQSGLYRIEYKNELSDEWRPEPGFEEVFRAEAPIWAPEPGLSAQLTVPQTGQRFYRVLWLNAPLADTLTDFRGVQNHNGWQYGYAQPAISTPGSPDWFVPLSTFSESRWVVNPSLYWTYIGRDTLRPNGTITTGGKQGVEQWPVIRWTATTTTRVRVNFNVLKLEDGVGNGMVLRLYHNGQQIGSNDLLAGTSGGGLGPLVEVTDGDQLDFAVDPKESDDRGDEASYRVHLTPE